MWHMEVGVITEVFANQALWSELLETSPGEVEREYYKRFREKAIRYTGTSYKELMDWFNAQSETADFEYGEDEG
jgi:hypothetical protein